MSEVKKPTRRWLQFHLSTLMVTMLLAGLLVGLNVWVFQQLGDLFRLANTTFVVRVLTVGFYGYLNLHLLIGVAIIWEDFIRRRETRKP